ncbi:MULTISPECIES: glycine cleavage system protein GcvH [Embleya]|uniref:glycine cleavage system protein GcvH n=1 Tax=Embleya TaxID=2699295 RepID=UPI00036E3B84|nr:glycine cleavage system protein GcvH [Embleya scabrispora]MYS80152.1 glycine cleavage system protein GcvH [Streptomyces sp. SID5474]
MHAPQHLRYSKEHEWLDEAASPALVGITKHAADALGDVVFVQLPEVGQTVVAGEPCGELESTKSVSDMYAPVSGEIVEINDAVAEDPALVNSDPFGAGWLFKVRIDGEAEGLLSADEYAAFCGE